jgi:betaine-aldehyde dehydrogenase
MAVATAAGQDVKRAHLELGGKAPVVVFDDVDIQAAVDGISVAGLFNGGQDCTAATRSIVQAGVYEDSLAALTEAAKNTKTGYDPTDEDIRYGPINNQNQLGHIAGLVDRAPDHARITTGGKRIDTRGYFYEPTVVADLAQRDELVRTEIFGPVMTVQKVTDEDEALTFSNDSEYALASPVWTQDVSVASRMAARLDFGCGLVNTHIPLQAEMPTEVSSTPATARTSGCTGSRTTRGSST